MWNEHNYMESEHSLALPFFGTGMKTDFFQSCGHCWVFQICWYTEGSTFTASSFKILNSSANKIVAVVVLVAQLCPTLCDPMNCSSQASSVHGLLCTRIPDWVAIPPPGDVPYPGIKHGSLTLHTDSSPSESPLITSERSTVNQGCLFISLLVS